MKTTQERERENVIQTIFNIILRATQFLKTEIHHGLEYVCISYRGLMMKTIRQKWMTSFVAQSMWSTGQETVQLAVVQKTAEDEVSCHGCFSTLYESSIFDLHSITNSAYISSSRCNPNYLHRFFSWPKILIIWTNNYGNVKVRFIISHGKCILR